MSEEEPRLGNFDHDAAGRRREAARERDEWLAATQRSAYARALTDEEVRRRLGPEARIISSHGGTPVGGWERLSGRGFAAQRVTESVGSASHDPDDLAAENRRLGPAVSVAKFGPNSSY